MTTRTVSVATIALTGDSDDLCFSAYHQRTVIRPKMAAGADLVHNPIT